MCYLLDPGNILPQISRFFVSLSPLPFNGLSPLCVVKCDITKKMIAMTYCLDVLPNSSN